MLVMFVCVHPLLLTLLLHLTLGVEFPSDLTDTGEHILQGGCGERIARIETALEAQSRFFSVSGRQTKKLCGPLRLGVPCVGMQQRQMR
jgi:hypothetical protein